jgi:hypothetical protein
MRWEGHLACIEEEKEEEKKKKKNAYRLLVGKPEEERPLGKSRHKWKDKR